MRIMLVSRVTADQRPGGMPIVASLRAQALADAGHDVHLITTSHSPNSGTIDREEMCEWSDNLTKHFVSAPAHHWSREFAELCGDACARLQPDIIHLDSFDRSNQWWLSRPSRTKRLAITMHGFGMGAWRTKWNLARVTGHDLPQPNVSDLAAEMGALRAFDVVVGVSRHEWRMLRDEYGLASAKLVYNPISQHFFDQPQSRRQRSYFLCAAVSQGDTRGFAACAEACRECSVQLETATRVPHKEMPDVYDGARAVLLPTAFCQGYDMAICEGRARGCPAIMAATGSYLDEAEPFDTLVGVHDAAGLAKAIADFTGPSDRRAVLASAERHRPMRHAESWIAAIGL